MSGRDLRERIRRRAQRASVEIAPEKLALLESYMVLLQLWNRRINLTSLQIDPVSDDAIDRLMIEAIIASKRLISSDRILVDIGSGGGSPAIPLKIITPSLRMILVEAKVRKTAFLREVIRQLRLENIEVENRRFEELLPRSDLHESVDVVTLRAVRAERRMWQAIQAFLHPGGRVLWFGSRGVGEAFPGFELVGSDPLGPAGASHLNVLRRI
jgi:16S rRNA (guanine527-N7)-methyltransferase